MTEADKAPEKVDNKTTIAAMAAGAFLIWAITVTALLAQEKGKAKSIVTAPTTATLTAEGMLGVGSALEGPNTCADKTLYLPNIECMAEAFDDGSDITEIAPGIGGQAGGNVTAGYNGELEVGVEPITIPYYQAGLCPVNVHWHLGTEHYSAGEYDCEMHDDEEHRDLMEDMVECGPSTVEHRRLAAGKHRKGYQCNLYDAEDEKFTKDYDWKFCDKTMEVGQTYEVHWPHSAAGACGTPNQYQTPFYDGVFCNLDVETFKTLGAQDIASNVGVQAQVFVIVNDESYYYPNLIKGMIVEPELEMGSDVAMYTGSTTGTSRSNVMCSQYSPITWQVDRKCHPISASSFDKMCADMMDQRDDMTDDLYAHGSRELVLDELTANNHANLRN